MSVTSYILNFESKPSTEEFQAQIRVDYSKEVYATETIIKAHILRVTKRKADYLKKIICFFYFLWICGSKKKSYDDKHNRYFIE